MIRHIPHLITRFLGSLSPRPVDPADLVWLRERIGEREAGLWSRMSLADRKHAVGVARDAARRLGSAATPSVLAAALLHDVGKVEAGLGTFGRAVATLVIEIVGRGRAIGWGDRGGVVGRIGRYAAHDQRGADLLRDEGADALAVAWAREHHRPESAWTVPADIGRVLHDVDDD